LADAQRPAIFYTLKTKTTKETAMNITPIVTLALLLGSPLTIAECMSPEAPTLPKGATSTMQDMIAGQQAVKAFQAENIVYMDCVEKMMSDTEAAAAKMAKTGSDEEKASSTAAHESAVSQYNNAVSKEEGVAGQFNTEIREYKAANPS
jgi:hypothetical protein